MFMIILEMRDNKFFMEAWPQHGSSGLMRKL